MTSERLGLSGFPVLEETLEAERKKVYEENLGAYPPDTSPAMRLSRGELAYTDRTSERYVAPGDSAGMFRLIADSYFDIQPENVLSIKERYDRLGARDTEYFDEPPRATIAVLAAIHDEPPEALEHTLSNVVAKQEGVEQDEIWVYGNMPADTLDEDKARAVAHFDAVVERFRQAHPHLKLRSTIEAYKYDTTRVLGVRYGGDVLMGRLRHDKLDLIAYDAQQRGGFKMDHPVVILDADTCHMTKDTVTQQTAKLTAPDSKYTQVHATDTYLFDVESSTESLTELPAARRLAMFQETRRRQWHRAVINDRKGLRDKDEGFGGNYFEEWGAAFALGPYLMAGGYNEYGEYNEARDLRLRLMNANAQISEVMRYAKPGIRSHHMALRPYVLKKAIVRGAGRRQEEFMRAWLQSTGEDEQYGRFTEGYIRSGLPYGRFSHTDRVRSAAPGAEPDFRSQKQAQYMVAAILKPDRIFSVGKPSSDPHPEILLPDPGSLLYRYGLPDPSPEEKGDKDTE